MWIKDLKLYNFRNYLSDNFEFTKGVNLVVGKNGQGKTNLIEAVEILSSVKSFRTSKYQNILTIGKEEFSVFGEFFNKDDSNYSLGLSYVNKKRRKLFYNNDPISKLDEYLKYFTTVSFTPDDILIIKQAPSLRRSFIDRHLCDCKPELLYYFINYSKALKSKNKLLKDKQGIDAVIVWNKLIAEYGIKINKEREEFLEKLEKKASLILENFTCNKESLKLKLVSDFYNEHKDEKSFYDFLNNNFEKEFYRGSSLFGVHRDDIDILINDNLAKSFASQGQSRSLILSLKLAVIELIEEHQGEKPVILLDDVDSEFDSKRSSDFFELIISKIFNDDFQVIITGTDRILENLDNLKDANLIKI